MYCSSSLKAGSHILWTALVGAIFLCCCFIIYNAVIHHNGVCISKASCSSSFEHKASRLSGENCKSECTSKECVEIANNILDNMNPMVDPCEDFNEFACGKYASRHGKKSNHSAVLSLIDDLYRKVRDIIETSEETHKVGSAAYKMKIVYDSCMKTRSLELAAIRSVQGFISQMGIHNWPRLASNFSFSTPGLANVLARLASYEEYVFVRLSGIHKNYIYRNDRDDEPTNTINMTIVSPQYPTYLFDWEEKELKDVVMGILHHTGLNPKQMNETWKDFMEVERGLQELRMNNSEENIVCEEESAGEGSMMDCSEESSKENILCRYISLVVLYGRKKELAKDQLYIECTDSHYIDNLPHLLDRYNDRELGHYIAMRVFINNLKYMNFLTRKSLKYFIKIPDREEESIELDRWKFCVSWISTYMSIPLGYLYASEMWPVEALDEIDGIVSEYVNTTRELLQLQSWIKDETKDGAMREVEAEKNNLNFIIGLFRNVTEINNRYKRFQPSPHSFIRNVFLFKKFHFTTSKLDGLAFWDMLKVFSVNAYGGDGVTLMFGILLPPVFKYGYPKLFNIAKIGQIIGHEVGHKLHLFLNYEVDNVTWINWSEKQQCLVDQYFKFQLKRIGKNVKGNFTIMENMPDNIAIKVSEKIVKKLIANMTENMFTLPGLPYSPEKLFYISHAQLWCEVRSIEKEMDHFNRDSHSPPQFRIQGPLQNSELFAQVFNCSTGSKMNPEKKCSFFD